MIELLVHSKHASCVIDHVFHFHQSELIQSISPHIHRMPFLDEGLHQIIVESGG